MSSQNARVGTTWSFNTVKTVNDESLKIERINLKNQYL